MNIPETGKTETYDISDKEFAAIKLMETGQFWATIVDRKKSDFNLESPFDENSKVIFLNTVDEVRDYLSEKATDNYKDQFEE